MPDDLVLVRVPVIGLHDVVRLGLFELGDPDSNSELGDKPGDLVTSDE